MRRTSAILLALVLPFQLFAQQIDSEKNNLAAFGREVREIAKMLRLPGLSVAIVHNGKIIYQQHEGYADLEAKKPITDDSIFWLSSVTKTFSAVMMMQYEREGRLSLNDPLVMYPFTSVGFAPQRINSKVRLKHVLSHTSESTPGSMFVYHGGRYNFLYGSFEAMSGLRFPQAFTTELNKRILQPLGLESTFAGYPGQSGESVKSRIVTPYRFDSEKKTYIVNQDVYGMNTAYPATGVLSSVKDLAAYTKALDDNRLIPKDDYERMTASLVTGDGRSVPYGLGWFTQDFEGIRMHWAYGLGDSDSSLLLRVPERKLTLILLSNSDMANVASRLGGGNALRSPFVIAFLRHVLSNGQPPYSSINYDGDVGKIRGHLNQMPAGKARPIPLEELFTQALIRSFTESKFGTKKGQAEALFRLFFETNRNAFTKPDPAIIHLLAQFIGPDLNEAADVFIKAYNTSGQTHPWILYSIARRFEDRGDIENATKYYHKLADTPGFEEQGDKIDAFSRLAKFYAAKKDFEKARDYSWKAFVYTRQAGYNQDTVVRELDEINRLAKSNGSR